MNTIKGVLLSISFFGRLWAILRMHLKNWRIDMTEEIYNKATNLRILIEKEKKALKYWKEAVDATDETITLSNGLGYNGYKKASIFRFISFKELKDMAIERLTMSLEQHQKMYEEL